MMMGEPKSLCGKRPCRCDARVDEARAREANPERIVVQRCPSCRMTFIGMARCGRCKADLVDVNEQPCGSCDICWDQWQGVRWCPDRGALGHACCRRCVPLRWYERLGLMDGGSDLEPGEDPNERICALFDELSGMRGPRITDIGKLLLLALLVCVIESHDERQLSVGIIFLIFGVLVFVDAWLQHDRNALGRPR